MPEEISAKCCIVGSGPAAHTAAVYTARAELAPVVFEGWMANGIAAGVNIHQATTIVLCDVCCFT